METVYKGNSNKSKELPTEVDREEPQKITRGNVSLKKETLGKKFAETFLMDNLTNVKNYIWNDVLVPGIKDTVCDIMDTTLHMLFYKSPNGRRTTKPSSNSRVSYSSYYRESDTPKKQNKSNNNGRYAYNDIIFEERGDALEVMNRMREIFDKYGLVRLSEYYDYAGVTTDLDNYTLRDWGWTDLNDGNMQLLKDRDGYRIRLPKVEPLE